MSRHKVVYANKIFQSTAVLKDIPMLLSLESNSKKISGTKVLKVLNTPFNLA